MTSWGAATAKAKFSEVLDRTVKEGPQAITRNGKAIVILVSTEEWESRAPQKENLADFLLRTAPRDSGVVLDRVKGKARAAKF